LLLLRLRCSSPAAAAPAVTFSFEQALKAEMKYAKQFTYEEKATAEIGIPFLNKAKIEVRLSLRYIKFQVSTALNASQYINHTTAQYIILHYTTSHYSTWHNIALEYNTKFMVWSTPAAGAGGAKTAT
jgi:hypothetical protein